jgi:hypothetical protein
VTPPEKELEQRKKAAQLSERMLSYIAPDFFAVHPVEAEAPEEDVLLLDFSFLSTVPEATLRVPGYSRWLEDQDHLPAYGYMRKLMLLLQWQRPGKRWVLKTPHHMEYLDTLFRVFPDAKIIQTHRDPAVALASFCSMLAHGRGVFSSRIDPREIGREWSRKVRRLVEATMRTRERMPGDRFLDVRYKDLVGSTVAQVRRIYDFLDIPWNGTIERLMEKNHSENRQYKYGHHTYRLEDFGLTKEDVRGDFAEYYRRYIDNHTGELVHEK